MTAAISLPPASYADDDALRTMTDRVLDGIRALPGVDTVGAVTVSIRATGRVLCRPSSSTSGSPRGSGPAATRWAAACTFQTAPKRS